MLHQQHTQLQSSTLGSPVAVLAGASLGDAENARHEIGGHENARNAIVWNTACCIAEQECMSRQERAPDFAADCVLVND